MSTLALVAAGGAIALGVEGGRMTPISPFTAKLIVPYLLWVSFAAWLNWAIVQLNAPFA